MSSVHSLRFQLFRNLTPTKTNFQFCRKSSSVGLRMTLGGTFIYLCYFMHFDMIVYYLYVKMSRVYLFMLAYVLDTIVKNYYYYLYKFIFLKSCHAMDSWNDSCDYEIIYVTTVGLYIYSHMLFMRWKHMGIYIHETRLRRYKPLLMYRSLVIAYRFTEVKMVTLYRSRLQM